MLRSTQQENLVCSKMSTVPVLVAAPRRLTTKVTHPGICLPVFRRAFMYSTGFPLMSACFHFLKYPYPGYCSFGYCTQLTNVLGGVLEALHKSCTSVGCMYSLVYTSELPRVCLTLCKRSWSRNFQYGACLRDGGGVFFAWRPSRPHNEKSITDTTLRRRGDEIPKTVCQ